MKIIHIDSQGKSESVDELAKQNKIEYSHKFDEQLFECDKYLKEFDYIVVESFSEEYNKDMKVEELLQKIILKNPEKILIYTNNHTNHKNKVSVNYLIKENTKKDYSEKQPHHFF